MNKPVFDDQRDDEQPLDPAAERLQKKLRRLLAGSSLIMVAGLIAVFAAIIYKINSGESSVAAENFAATIALGANAEVLDVEVINGRFVVLVRENGATALLQLDPATGREIGRTDFIARAD